VLSMKWWVPAAVVCATLTVSTRVSAEESSDPEEVEASVLSVLPDDYDGKRVRTQFSLMNVGDLKAKKVGCEKDDIYFSLGPKVVPGQMPQMLKGVFILCVSKADAPKVVTQQTGSQIVIDGTVSVKRLGDSRRITFADTVIVSIEPIIPPSKP